MAGTVTAAAPQDRRAATRFTPETRALSTRARLRHGAEVTIVDVSATGVLIEGRCRLRPGGVAVIRLELADEAGALSCRVVRCHVSAVGGQEGVCYRAALAFPQPLVLDDGSPGSV